MINRTPEPYRLYLNFGSGLESRDRNGKLIPTLVGWNLRGMKLAAWVLNRLTGSSVDIDGPNGREMSLPHRGRR